MEGSKTCLTMSKVKEILKTSEMGFDSELRREESGQLMTSMLGQSQQMVGLKNPFQRSESNIFDYPPENLAFDNQSPFTQKEPQVTETFS